MLSLERKVLRHYFRDARGPIACYERRNAPRSKDYEFGLAILDGAEKRKAEVHLSGATKIKFNKQNQLKVDTTASLKPSWRMFA